MPKTGVNYTKTASYSPINATAPNYTWSVTGGVILSGQGTPTVTYNFTAVGAQLVDLVVSNACSSSNFQEPYSVCEAVTGLAISGPITVLSNSIHFYNATAITGLNGSTRVWSISGAGATILSGQGTNQIEVQFGSVGSVMITLTVTDCDGIDSIASIIVDQTGAVCVGITGCSFS
jgi:hypothetical protein